MRNKCCCCRIEVKKRQSQDLYLPQTEAYVRHKNIHECLVEGIVGSVVDYFVETDRSDLRSLG